MNQPPAGQQQDHAVVGFAQRTDGSDGHRVRPAVEIADDDEPTDALAFLEPMAAHGRSPARSRKTSAFARPTVRMPSAVVPALLAW